VYFRSPIEASRAIAGHPCLGCGGHADVTGYFTPTPRCLRDDFGVRGDRPITIAYAVCEACARRSSKSSAYVRRIEDTIISRVSRKTFPCLVPC
jgi:hypothetical protein